MATFRKAQRSKAKLRLAVCGVSGGGKTYSSLLIGSGITSWDKIAVIDSENGSADLYAHLGDYSVLTISPPYTPEKYTQAIIAAEKEGFELIIIDSLTHAWAGDGGLLDKKGQIEKSGKPGVNSWTAWRDITPQHNKLVESILQSKCHIIATLRAKMDYIQEKKGEKTVITKVGMNPIQREGMEYEFTVFFDIDTNHTCTSSKDRTSLFDGQYFKPDQKTGEQLLEWLENGTDVVNQEVIKEKRLIMAHLVKELNYDSSSMSTLIKDQFKVNSSKDLSEKQLDELIAYLQSMKDTTDKKDGNENE